VGDAGRGRAVLYRCQRRRPPIPTLFPYTTLFRSENNNVIMAIHVPKAKREQKPVYINGDMFNGTFRRNWEGDYHCDRSEVLAMLDRKSTRLNSSHVSISYAVFCLKKKKNNVQI